jgi:hypothetical protein
MPIAYRDATEADLSAIVALLADDELGAGREDASLPLAGSYIAAFQAIASMPHQRLIVAADGERIVGTMQLLLIPGLSAQAAGMARSRRCGSRPHSGGKARAKPSCAGRSSNVARRDVLRSSSFRMAPAARRIGSGASWGSHRATSASR